MTPAPRTLRCKGTCAAVARTLRELTAQLASPFPLAGPTTLPVVEQTNKP